MKNKKGFTLVELLAVITIMCIILLIAFPSTVKLIEQNNQKKYQYYYELIENAAIAYANTRQDDLGGIEGKGCVEIDLNTLIDTGFIKKFDEEDIICDTPTASGQAKIQISNDEGNVSTKISLICTKDNKKKKVVYEKIENTTGSCDAYVPKDENVLITKLNDNLSSKVTQDGTNFFITGTSPNNYVLYSGKLWRVVSYDMKAKTVKLILDDVISVGSYLTSSATANYANSNILTWLENEFLSTLRNSDKILSLDTWNYTTVTSTAKPANTNTRRGKVGLLNLYEYSKVKAGNYLATDSTWWLLSPYSALNSWYVDTDETTKAAAATKMYGIRPVVTLQSQITYMDATETNLGSKDNPYRITGERKVTSGTYLNTRYSGEYVKFYNEVDEDLYRIVSTSTEGTKLVLNTVTDTTQRIFDSTYYEFSGVTDIGIYLNETWYNTYDTAIKNIIIDGEWCIEPVDETRIQRSKCSDEKYIKTNKVGLLKLGEPYANAISYEYWTLNSYLANNYINVIKPDGTITQKIYNSTSYVRPAINVDKSVKVISGLGTETDPYILLSK